MNDHGSLLNRWGEGQGSIGAISYANRKADVGSRRDTNNTKEVLTGLHGDGGEHAGTREREMKTGRGAYHSGAFGKPVRWSQGAI